MSLAAILLPTRIVVGSTWPRLRTLIGLFGLVTACSLVAQPATATHPQNLSAGLEASTTSPSVSRASGLEITFTRILDSPVVTEPVHSYGCSWIDYDNDNFIDLFVTSGANVWSGGNTNRLYRNNGDGTFTRLTAAEVGDILSQSRVWGGSSWGDYNNDGHSDLYVGAWYEVPVLCRNSGDGRLERVSDAGALGNEAMNTWVGCWGDYDQDGFLDLFLTAWNAEMKLFRNLGNGTFTVTNGPWSTARFNVEYVTWADMDSDGDLDLTITAPGSVRALMYENLGGGQFASLDNVITRNASALNTPTWGDYDNDGRLDLFLAGGTVDPALP